MKNKLFIITLTTVFFVTAYMIGSYVMKINGINNNILSLLYGMLLTFVSIMIFIISYYVIDNIKRFFK